MADVDDQLLQHAREALGVDFVQQLCGGFQKEVQLVRRGGEDLVLKVVSLDGSSPDALRRAEREVELLGSLDSPYVVRVASELVELEEPVRGAAWLEEYLDGTDLGALLFNRQWSWEETATMGLHVAHGLGAAHAAKVVHRDLSANNVRRLSSGDFKVMDFGFARHTLRSGLTVAGQPGTPGYASPEHLHSYSGTPTPASSPPAYSCSPRSQDSYRFRTAATTPTTPGGSSTFGPLTWPRCALILNPLNSQSSGAACTPSQPAATSTAPASLPPWRPSRDRPGRRQPAEPDDLDP